MKPLSLLNVEDSDDDAALLLRHLVRGGYDVRAVRVQTAATMKEALTAEDWDIIISDYQMPGFSGLGALDILKESGLDIPFIIISGTIGEDTAVQAMIAGVNDYLMKNNLARLIPAIERELQEARNRKARHKAEEDLKDSENRLQLALSASRMGVWEWDLKTGSLYLSPECFEIVKLQDFHNTFKELADFIHPEDIGDVIAKTKEAIEENKHFYAEFRLTVFQGEMQWLSTFGLMEYEQDRTPRRMIGTVQDITERKQSEVALRDSEEKFRALVQATTHYVWTVDANQENAAYSEWWKDLTGQTADESRDWGWVEALHPDDRETTIAAWKKSLVEKSVFNTIYRALTKSGKYLYFAVRGVPICNPDGTLRRWIGTLNDITQRKKSEEELIQSERRFRTLVSATAQIVWTASSEGVLLTAHKANGEAINKTGDDLGDDWFSRVHPSEKDRVIADFFAAVQNRTNYLSEYRMLHDNNKYHNYISRGMPVFEKNGHIREWIGTLTDITESKRAETELLKKEEQLRQSQKLESVGRLAGGIAHDFNNMLTVINGYSDLVLRGLTSDDPMHRRIVEIKTAGERAAELTNQLLAFSRQQILETKVIDVNQLISDTIVMLHRLIGEDIQIITNLKPDLCNIEADSGKLSQIIMNLIINSRDAMPKGGNIMIKTEDVYLDEEFVKQNIDAKIGEFILLQVTDTGTGMDEEVKAHIFEPFFTTKEIGHGTGLGLSTVYGIINQFGGSVSVKSEVGAGTTFQIYLPAIKNAKEALEIQINTKKLQTGTETILLVEDEEMVRKLTRQVLETAGFVVIEAQDGAHAIAICEKLETKIDLLITDVVMPKMSGRVLADNLVGICPVVLFTSGYTDDDIIRHGITNTTVNFLQKPFTMNELIGKVRGVLDSSSA